MNQDDPAQRIARTAELLWGAGQPGKRGPKPRLSLDKIARAAIAIADTDGLAAVSMQRVAADLGYTPMSLYTYVPTKDLLLDVMMDTAAGACLTEPGDHPDWRAELHAYVADMWTMFEGHPWILQVQVIGPPLGPNQLTWFERLLSILDNTRLPRAEHAAVGLFLLSAVRGMAKVILDMREVSASAADALAADAMSGDMLARFADPHRFPFLTAAYGPAPEPDSEWYGPGTVPPDLRLGIDRLLDGFEAGS
ncbi:MAG: TetR/AcrR family transcriptional regulator [Stackebrandtia sp.]